ncbi:MAG TPA: BTAD domain-containing putative transcriptional regulator [Streptosporangiaceae bacterium]|nr:BTAD domain-containing putative transcriptional regulator [Streptosporangiaceae bacterium]
MTPADQPVLQPAYTPPAGPGPGRQASLPSAGPTARHQVRAGRRRPAGELAPRAAGRPSRRALAAGIGSLAVLAALVAGLPAVLILLAGSPLPHHLPSWHQVLAALSRPDDGTLFLAAVRLATWIAWGIFTVTVTAEAAARIRGRPAPRLPITGPARTLAAALIGAAILGLLPARHASAARAPGPPVPECPVAAAPWHPRGTSPGTAGTHRARPARDRAYRVRPGDDLWAIAARYLGDGERWHEIFRLSRNLPQPGGQRLTDPGYIRPGWRLLLPPRPGGSPPPAPRRHPARPAPPGPGPRLECPPAPGRGEPAGRPPHGPGIAREEPSGGPAITLPGGGLVPVALAAAVSSAAVLAAIHRRRNYRPSPAAPSRLRPDQPAEQAVITRLRRAARKASRRPQPARARLPEAASAVGRREPAGLAAGHGGAPRLPAPAVRLGVRGEHEITADISALGGLGLTGPGAPAAARAILAGLLSQAWSGKHSPLPVVIVPGGDAAVLLPGLQHDPGQAGIPGLELTRTLGSALDRAEILLLQRARTARTSPSAGSAGRPDAPAVLIAAPGRPPGRRLRAIIDSGRRLGFSVILLGDCPGGTACHVTAGGIAASPDPGLDGARLYSLSAADAAAILSALHAASGPGQPANEALPGRHRAPSGTSETAPAPEHRPPGRAPAGGSGPPASPGQHIPADSGAPKTAASPEPGQRPATAPVRDRQPQEPGPPGPADTAPNLPERKIVHVEVLGPLRITAAGREITGGLRKARELLAYLALHPAGVTPEAISEALWPGTPASHGTSQRHLAIRKLRQLLRTTTCQPEPMFILLAAGRYRLDPACISTDTGMFESALDHARNTREDSARLMAWRRAAALYRGPLADGAGYDWAEPYAEAARRRALDAWTCIAGLLEPADPDQALAALDTALTHDPYNEDLYQRIMRLQIDRGQPDAARRTLSLLATRLAELGLEPDPQTRQLLRTQPASRTRKARP